jgi:hypothetical protein
MDVFITCHNGLIQFTCNRVHCSSPLFQGAALLKGPLTR